MDFLKPFRRAERRNNPFAEPVDYASDGPHSGAFTEQPGQELECGPVEYPIGLISRSCSAARVDGVMLDPFTLASYGRDIATKGNCVLLFESGRFIRPTGFSVTGGSLAQEQWTYLLNLHGPGRGRDVSATGENVAHIRYAPLPNTPWRGRSPLELAKISVSAMTGIERNVANEAGAPTGALVEAEQGTDDAKSQSVLDNLFGKTRFFDRGKMYQSQSFAKLRVGLDLPESTLLAREQLGETVARIFGITPGLREGSGGAYVSALRMFYETCLIPLGRLLESELGRVAERPGITVSFPDMLRIDSLAASRTLKVLVDSGIPVEDAVRRSGILRLETE